MTYVNQEAAEVSGETIGFSFGANWKRFLTIVDEPIIVKAVESFVNFTHLPRLDDYDFLDLGCGSGLSSLVALRLGARRVLSIDIDPNSIECAAADCVNRKESTKAAGRFATAQCSTKPF